MFTPPSAVVAAAWGLDASPAGLFHYCGLAPGWQEAMKAGRIFMAANSLSETSTLGGTYRNELFPAKGTFGLVAARTQVYALFPFVPAKHAGQEKDHMALVVVLGHPSLLSHVIFSERSDVFWLSTPPSSSH
jgi:hypothetical protein